MAGCDGGAHAIACRRPFPAAGLIAEGRGSTRSLLMPRLSKVAVDDDRSWPQLCGWANRRAETSHSSGAPDRGKVTQRVPSGDQQPS